MSHNATPLINNRGYVTKYISTPYSQVNPDIEILLYLAKVV